MRSRSRVEGTLVLSLVSSLVIGCSSGGGAGKGDGAAASGGASGGITGTGSSGGSGGHVSTAGGSGGSAAIATGGSSGSPNVATGGSGGAVAGGSGGQGGTAKGANGQAGAGASGGAGVAGAPAGTAASGGSGAAGAGASAGSGMAGTPAGTGASAGSGMAGAPANANQALASTSCTTAADWCQHLQTLEGLSASFVTLNAAGEVIVAADSGFTQLIDLGGGLTGGQLVSDLAVAKYTPDGALVWSRVFGSPAVDEFVAGLATDANGNIFVGGDGHDKDAYGGVFIAKLSSQGDVLWSKIPVSFDSSRASSLAVDAQGNAVLMEQGGRLRKFSPDGDVLWSAVLPKSSRGGGVAIDASGNIFTGGTNTKGLLAEFSSAGAVTWTKDLGDEVTAPIPFPIRIDHNNGDLVMVTTPITGARSLSRYSSTGTMIWTKAMDQALYTLDALSLDGQGNTFVVGMSSDFTAQVGYGTYLAEYSPNGDRRGGLDLGIPGGSRNRDVVASPAGVAFVTGLATGTAGPFVARVTPQP